MSVKLAKGDLTRLLEANGGDANLVGFDRPPTIVPTAVAEPVILPDVATLPPPEAITYNARAVAAAEKRVGRSLKITHDEFNAARGAAAPQSSSVSSPNVSAPRPGEKKNWRSQGIVIYESDLDLVDGFSAHIRKRKIRAGRRGFSLYARAGLRALEQLRIDDPDAFEAMLARASQEQS
jgi:hypothetical protein